MQNEHPTYRPSAFYFRSALREAPTKEAAVGVGLTVVSELESLKAWVREQGYIPPKHHLMLSETVQKGWSGSEICYRL